MTRRTRSLLLLIFVALTAAAVLSVLLGGGSTAHAWNALAAHQAMLHRWVARAPLVAGAVYCVAYVACVALSLPLGTPLTVTGGLLFGTVAGTALAAASASGGAILLFLLARSALAPLLARRAGPFLDRLRPGLQRDGFSWLLALRLVPAVPFWLLNLAPALLGMRLAPYAAATVLGIIPAAAVLAGIGAGLGDVLDTGAPPDLSVLRSPPVLLPLAGLVALSLLPVAWRRIRRTS
jgi:uncharacterized membrane protein YdjX (TVP38/TMEM64 family)